MANEVTATTTEGARADGSADLVDGRTLRRRRNVEAVLAAVISLAGDGEMDPTAEEIADRAGVSHRSIYRYFDSRTDLLEAAMSHGADLLAPVLLFDDVGTGPLDDRIARFVDTRASAYWQFRSVLRAAFAQPDETVQVRLAAGRTLLRSQLCAHFAPELSQLDADQRSVLVALLDTPFQFESLEYMTTEAGLDRRLLADALTQHLHRWLP